MPLKPNARRVFRHPARFRLLTAGRRFGKTYLSLDLLAYYARIPNSLCWYIAPTRDMAKDLMWDMLKEKLERKRWLRDKNEVDLQCNLINGSAIRLRSAERPDRLRGRGLSLVVPDECADIKEETWSKVLRPALSDKMGHAVFLGTPKGRNWFYELYKRGQSEAIEDNDWMSWQFTTVDGGWVTPEEVEAARRELDQLSYEQEYEASFVNFHGQAYYDFSFETHATRPLEYRASVPLDISFDFNIAPGVAVISQEIEGKTHCIDEVYIPRNSNTPAICAKVKLDWGEKHEGQVRMYGDATGGAGGTAKVAGSDWDLIRSSFSEWGDRVEYRVPRANPAERARVNAMNSRIQTAEGEKRLIVDPVKCPNLIRDLEGVRVLEGGDGRIDKKADLKLTHISDALGYMVAREFPVNERDTSTESITL